MLIGEWTVASIVQKLFWRKILLVIHNYDGLLVVSPILTRYHLTC